MADGQRRVRVLDAEHETALVLAEADSISAARSPGGGWAAVSVVEPTDDGLTKALSVVDVASGARVEIGAGLEPTWLAP